MVRSPDTDAAGSESPVSFGRQQQRKRIAGSPTLDIGSAQKCSRNREGDADFPQEITGPFQ